MAYVFPQSPRVCFLCQAGQGSRTRPERQLPHRPQNSKLRIELSPNPSRLRFDQSTRQQEHAELAGLLMNNSQVQDARHDMNTRSKSQAQ